jgi:protein-S-isoprenylcysteine O-methyltransferase Ste14
MKRVPPPIFLLAAVLLQWLLRHRIPLVVIGSPALRWVGYALLAASFGLAIPSVRLFLRRTTLAPHKVPAELVVTGPYRLSRNPMYLSLTVLLFGTAALYGGLTGFLVPLLFAAVVTKVFIAPEEASMSTRFGDSYREYAARVRRWL